jgi:hypothetical protein
MVRRNSKKPTMRNLLLAIAVMQAIMMLSALYIAWRVKDIYDAIPGEPINVTIDKKP